MVGTASRLTVGGAAKRLVTRPHVLFLHVGWARAYRGDVDDLPKGKFGHLLSGATDIGEAFNFRAYAGVCYGYSPVHKGSVDIGKLGASVTDDHVKGVLVVWTATDPGGEGRFVVGWWHDATVYRTLQVTRPQRNRPEFIARAESSNCRLLAPDERTRSIPARVKGWPGISSSFFASATLKRADLDSILRYVEVTDKAAAAPQKRKSTPSPRTIADPILRERVERVAVALVTAHFQTLGYVVDSVEEDSKGWDLEATNSVRTLKIEVKGRGGVGRVELTPNEYVAMCDKKHRAHYRLAIVHSCLEGTPTLRVFRYSKISEKWADNDGVVLNLKSMTGAVASF